MNNRKLVTMALFITAAMMLSYIESLFPFFFGVPGMKLGLANLAAVFALCRMGVRDAAVISLVRVVLVSITFGNAYSFAYSFAGAALSLAVMALLKKTGKFSVLGVSIAGGVSHNVGQVLVAMAVLGTARLAWYLPALLVSGTAAGAAIGAAAGIVASRVKA